MPTDKEFEDFFRSRFENLEETPPAQAWENIRQQLKPRKRFRWLPAFIFLGLMAIATLMPFVSKNLFPAANKSAVNSGEAQQSVNENSVNRNTNVLTNNATEVANAETGKTNKSIAIISDDADQTANRKQTGINVKNSNNPNSGNIASTNKHLLASAGKTNQAETNAIKAAVKAEKHEAKLAKAETKATAKKERAAKKWYALQAKNASSKNNNYKDSGTHRKATKNAMATAEYYKPTTKTSAAHKNNATAVNNTKNINAAEITLLRTRTTNPVSLSNFAIPAFFNLPSDSVLMQVVPVEYTDERVVPNMAISVYAAPQYTLNSVAVNQGNEANASSLKTDKAIAENAGFEAGVLVHKRLATKTTLDGGIKVASLKSNVTYVMPGTFVAESRSLKMSATYAGLQLGFTQSFHQSSKGRFYGSGGAAMIMLLNGKTELYIDHALQDKISSTDTGNQLNKVNYSAFAGLGYERYVSRRAAISVQPTVNYYFKSTLNKQASFSQKPVTFGLNIGVKYDL